MSVIPQTPRACGVLLPLGPLPGLCLRPARDLKRSPDPSPPHAPPPPLTTDPGSAPAYDMYIKCYTDKTFNFTITYYCFDNS